MFIDLLRYQNCCSQSLQGEQNKHVAAISLLFVGTWISSSLSHTSLNNGPRSLQKTVWNHENPTAFQTDFGGATGALCSEARFGYLGHLDLQNSQEFATKKDGNKRHGVEGWT